MSIESFVNYELGQARSLAFMVDRIEASTGVQDVGLTRQHEPARGAVEGHPVRVLRFPENKNPTPRILADKGVGFPTEKEDSDGND